MSAFSDWFDNERPPMYSVHTDRQSQDRCIAEQAFYAGMERAACKVALLEKIPSRQIQTIKNEAYRHAAKEIRKEIE